MDKQTKKEFQNLARIVNGAFEGAEGRFNKRFDKIEAGMTGLRVDMAEIKTDVRTIKQKTDETWTLLDGYVKSQEEFKQEFEIMKYKLGKIEKVLKEKLGVEIN